MGFVIFFIIILWFIGITSEDDGKAAKEQQEIDSDDCTVRDEVQKSSKYYINKKDKQFFANNWINGKSIQQSKILFVSKNFSSNLMDKFFSYEGAKGIEGLFYVLYQYNVKNIDKMTSAQYGYSGKASEVDCIVLIHTGGDAQDFSNFISYIKTHGFKTKVIVIILNNSNKVKRTMQKVGADSVFIYNEQLNNNVFLSDITTWFSGIVDTQRPIENYDKKEEGYATKKIFRCSLCKGILWIKEDNGYTCKGCNCFYSPSEMKKLRVMEWRVDMNNATDDDIDNNVKENYTYDETDDYEVEKKIPIALKIDLDRFIMMEFPNGLNAIFSVFVNQNEVYFATNNSYIKVDCAYGLYQEYEHLSFDIQETIVLNDSSIAKSIVNTIGYWVGVLTHCTEFNEEDICNTMNAQGNQALKAYDVEMRFSKQSLKFIYNKKFISIENALRMLEKCSYIEKKENYIFEIPEEWSACRGVIDQEFQGKANAIVPRDTAYFTESTYVCVNCKRNINKVLINRGSKINVAKQQVEIDKVFSCKYCNIFYAPFMGKTLGCGAFMYLKTESARYQKIVKELDRAGRRAE